MAELCRATIEGKLFQPARLDRLAHNASVAISIAGRKMLIVLPDLGQDRDIYVGQNPEADEQHQCLRVAVGAAADSPLG